ncbi:MAG: FtsX-like permease family protein, partial [bacterium]|nr:FtsX-like permease family protein [bacterium]
MNKPPKIAKYLLKIFVNSSNHYSYLGDVEEVYYEIAGNNGVLKAKFWYLSQVIKMFFPYLKEAFLWRYAMFKNYLKIAFRNIKRQKAYSFINIAGLSVGMAVCILIFNYILFEMSYDKYHTNADSIYRVTLDANVGGMVYNAATSSSPTGEALVKDYPEILNACRIWYNGRMNVKYADDQFEEESVYYADNSVFEIFDYHIIKGDKETPLERPYTVVITESTAQKYFGDEDPVGRMIRMGSDKEYMVTAVMRDVPANSYCVFDMLISMQTRYQRNPASMARWVPLMYHTFVLLEDDYDIRFLESKFPDFIDRYMGEILKAIGGTVEYRLQPLTSIHLHSHLESELGANSDIKYIYLLSLIALFIISLACINFMNLATARSTGRSREVGIRKVLGAEKRRLIIQFIGESVIYSLFALFFALIMVKLVQPLFNSLSGIELNIDLISNPLLILSLIGLSVFVGFAAGSYPAFFLSAFRPVAVLKSKFIRGKDNAVFRNFLVGFQFVISISLIIGSMVIYSQLNYMKNQKLGFDKEQILIIPVRSIGFDNVESAKEQLTTFHGVLNVSSSSAIPGQETNVDVYVPEGYSVENKQIMMSISVDHNYISTHGMELVKGRDFSPEISTDRQNAIIINETAAAKFGWEDPIGKEIRTFTDSDMNELQTQIVVGVVKDYHHFSLHKKIEPLHINCSKTNVNQLSIRLRPGMITESLEFMETKCNEINPDGQFNYYFLDDSFEKQYKFEEQLGDLFFYFTLLAIFIACLGLFGLSSFNAEQRIKEIGIRKTLGAKVSGIVILLNKEL